MITIKSSAGSHITTACKRAIDLANEKNEEVQFTFNEVAVVARPGDDPETLYRKWDADREAARQAWLASPEYKAREAEREAAAKAARERHMVEAASTEFEMRDARVPWPLTKAQLIEYIDSLTDRQHDYGTCVYAMSMAATAAFYYVSSRLGVTGFQASCADLDSLRRTRNIDGPFLLIKGEDALYPQSDPYDKLTEAMGEWKPWLKKKAAERLATVEYSHPKVKSHWEELASL